MTSKITEARQKMTQAAKLLMRPGQVYELRALGVPAGNGYTKTFAGWFDNPDKLASEAERFDKQLPDYVSITINPVKSDLLARSANKMKQLKKGDPTSTDADIVSRTWLPIDLDPIRPAGISSTDEEHQSALQLAFQVAEDFSADGWPQPIISSSGNGAHVLYSIDLPSASESDLLVTNTLRALAAKYDNEQVKIDTQLGNASRILKLWGVMSRKGDDIPTRPHRRSGVLSAPEEIKHVPLELLKQVAATLPKIAPLTRSAMPANANVSLYERARAYLERCEPAISGQGGDRTTFRTACVLVNDFGLDEDSAYSLLSEWNARCSPPWPERQLRDKVTHAKSYAKKTGGNLAEQRLERKIQKHHKEEIIQKKLESIASGESSITLRDVYNQAKNTDLGNAERLIAGSDGKIKYSHARGWFAWEGRYWIPDEAAVRRLYHDHVIKNIYKEVELSYAENDSSLTKSLIDWAKKSEGTRNMKSALEMAAGMAAVTFRSGDIDKDPLLFCCNNGVVNLKTGELLDHSPDYMMTRISNVNFDASAKCPKWEQFLQDIFQDHQIIEYLQLAVGYSLSGLTTEQCMFIMYGTGQNGKSVFSNILSALLGSYSMETPPETLMRGRSDGSNQPTNDVARLAGARLVSANETEEGQCLAESKVKAMTGDDLMTARFLHKEFFEFRPQFKIWIRTNHKPKIRGTDTGIWRRVKLIPFKICISAEKRDPDLTKKLMAELPGILNWAVEGCKLWQFCGMATPESVSAATEDYRTSQDLIGLFLNETFEVCPNKTSGMVAGKSLYKSYCEWCDEAGERPIPHRVLSIKLSERGFTRRRTGRTGQVVWDGLRLAGEDPQNQSLYGGANE